MEKFFTLSEDKQHVFLEAAFTVFARGGYKNASAAEIGSAAGIAKSLVAHYFGEKKSMYLYMVKLCADLLIAALQEGFVKAPADFFDRIKLSSDIKAAVLDKRTSMLYFVNSVYCETDHSVAADVKEILTKLSAFDEQLILKGTDPAPFKDGVDPRLVMKIISRFTEGERCIPCQTPLYNVFKTSAALGDCLWLLRSNLYRESALTTPRRF